VTRQSRNAVHCVGSVIVNSPGGEALLLSEGKYDVTRALAAPHIKEIPQLPHAVAA